ncbi:MAG: anthranilate phosphoribosyltransferase [Planctomycetes bacterium]|nr:anthranilate phosphoribosyltransferase [Planctomycetota bacterium]
MKHLLAQLVAGKTLSPGETVEAFELIMTGQATPAQVGALLAMIQSRGPTVAEIAGAARVMRANATRVATPPGLKIIDTCGTGGDHSRTFNISTAAALVAAGAGRPLGVAVAKHGNRSVTSMSGSSQVLQELGVKLRVEPAALTRCLDEAGVCFCFAPSHHPATKHVTGVRQDLGFRTLFNLLGPLTNPAFCTRQVMGVFDASLTDPIAQVLRDLGSERAMIVHGRMGEGTIDEISTGGPTRISELRGGKIVTIEMDAKTLGLANADPAALRVSDPAQSAAVVRSVLSGGRGPARDIVAVNAAAALVVADAAGDLKTGLQMAEQAIDSGAAARALEKLAAITRADPTPEA